MKPLRYAALLLAGAAADAQPALLQPAPGPPTISLRREVSGVDAAGRVERVVSARPEAVLAEHLRGQSPHSAASAGSPLTTIVPGDDPEGDNTSALTFTPAGDRLLVTNAFTHNLTVLDAETRAVLATVPVGIYPSAVAATDEVAVVACFVSNDVYVVDLATYTVRNVVSGVPEPMGVALMPDRTQALVTSQRDAGGVFLALPSGTVEATLPDLGWNGFTEYSVTTSVFREAFRWNPPEISGDGATIVAYHLGADIEHDGLLFVDAGTGAVLDTLVLGPSASMYLAPDGRHLVSGGTVDFVDWEFRRIDLTTRSVVASLSFTGDVWTNLIAPVLDGEQFVIGVLREGRIVAGIGDFTAGAVTLLDASGPMVWAEAVPGGRYVVGGGLRGEFVLDMSTREGSALSGAPLSPPLGALAPDGARAASPTWNTFEGVRFTSHDAGDLALEGAQVTGVAAEGDGPYSAALLGDGRHALVTQPLSQNLAVVDLLAGVVARTVPSGLAAYYAEPLRDGRRAVAIGEQGLALVDVEAGALLDQHAVPSGLDAVAGADALVFLQPNGYLPLDSLLVFSALGDSLALARVHESLAIRTLAARPDGQVVLAADPFRNVVAFFDGTTGEETARFTIPQPRGAAFSPDGALAYVISGSAPTLYVFDTTGPAVGLARSFPVAALPTDVVAHGPLVLTRTGASLYAYDPQTGALVETLNVGGASRFGFSLGGELVVLGGSNNDILRFRGELIQLPHAARDLLVAPGADRVLITHPGPDLLSVVDLTAVAAEPGAPSAAPLALSVAPNPTLGPVSFTVSRRATAPATLEVFDALGRRLLHTELPVESGDATVSWDAAGAPPGVYLARVRAGGGVATARFTVTRQPQ